MDRHEPSTSTIGREEFNQWIIEISQFLSNNMKIAIVFDRFWGRKNQTYLEQWIYIFGGDGVPRWFVMRGISEIRGSEKGRESDNNRESQYQEKSPSKWASCLQNSEIKVRGKAAGVHTPTLNLANASFLMVKRTCQLSVN